MTNPLLGRTHLALCEINAGPASTKKHGHVYMYVMGILTDMNRKWKEIPPNCSDVRHFTQDSS